MIKIYETLKTNPFKTLFCYILFFIYKCKNPKASWLSWLYLYFWAHIINTTFFKYINFAIKIKIMA